MTILFLPAVAGTQRGGAVSALKQRDREKLSVKHPNKHGHLYMTL